MSLSQTQVAFDNIAVNVDYISFVFQSQEEKAEFV